HGRAEGDRLEAVESLGAGRRGEADQERHAGVHVDGDAAGIEHAAIDLRLRSEGENAWIRQVEARGERILALQLDPGASGTRQRTRRRIAELRAERELHRDRSAVRV